MESQVLLGLVSVMLKENISLGLYLVLRIIRWFSVIYSLLCFFLKENAVCCRLDTCVFSKSLKVAGVRYFDLLQSHIFSFANKHCIPAGQIQGPESRRTGMCVVLWDISGCEEPSLCKILYVNQHTESVYVYGHEQTPLE